MKYRVLFFYPENPWPPHSGTHWRCMQMLGALKEFNTEIFLVSSALSDYYSPWNKESVAVLKKDFVADVFIYEPNRWDYKVINCLRRFYDFLGKQPPLNSLIYTPWQMRDWFTKVLYKVSPQIIIMSYAYWDSLLKHRRLKRIKRIIDIYDLVSLNRKAWTILSRFIGSVPIDPQRISERIVKEDFFTDFDLSVSSQEFLIYDQYDYAIAISEKEAQIIKENTRHTQVLFIPIVYQPHYINNQYNKVAIFPTGPNPFNIQGYLYFVKKVLPQVLKEIDSFLLQVIGYCAERVVEQKGIILTKTLIDLKPVYETSSFLVAPLLFGTGQQIKIIEAMAYGLPVIALRNIAQNAFLLQHGINGFIANNAQEFARYTVELWNDPKLCRKLGEAGREMVAKEFSSQRLKEALSKTII